MAAKKKRQRRSASAAIQERGFIESTATQATKRKKRTPKKAPKAAAPEPTKMIPIAVPVELWGKLKTLAALESARRGQRCTLYEVIADAVAALENA